ncbi:MAG: protein translocase subunit SecD [Deltaproteobacteria bacterium]|jgi:preprotein translocase subunit SecD|nr:protein translocase subunit SecD [Deltaproteobacteria bacterium]MBT4525610.1 protein translocase subunit SecD [Deltaproteobacteria bacterium]
MKIPWKGLAILLVFLTAVFYDIPTLKMFLPEDDHVILEKNKSRLEKIKALYSPFKQISLAIITKDKTGIQLITEGDFKFSEDNQIFKEILEDNFEYQKDEVSHLLKLKDNADDDVFVSDISNKINGVITNSKKIKSVQLDEFGSALIFEVEPGRRLSSIINPMKTILGNDLDLSFQENKSRYISRQKASSGVVNLGLDLQGGMYLDIGIRTDEIYTSVLDQLVEDIEDALIEDNVNYQEVIRVESSVNVILEPDETFDLTSERYQRLLEANFDVEKISNGFTISINSEEIDRIKKKSIKLTLEVIRNRIDQLGVKEPTVQQQGENSIIIQLPGLKDPEQARRVIAKAATLKFMLVAEDGSIDNPTRDQAVLFQENRDPITKELISSNPVLLEKKVLLSGDRIRDSRVRFSETGTPSVGIVFDEKGKDIFSDITKANIGRRLAIILDDKVYSSPTIQGHIPNGEGVITGSFSTDEASELSMVLRSGALPARIVIHEERTVGASLGEDSIRQSLVALALGFSLVIVFMIIYYEVSGIFSVLALLFNLLLILAALAYFGATLTLPGMAGIILTIGMAVDANVLIFERIREEINRGSPIRTAIHTGFQKATITILDSNITTILAAIVLFQFGTGPIKGFSVTLSIGIAASMFTSIVVGRFLFELFYLKRNKLEKLSI